MSDLVPSSEYNTIVTSANMLGVSNPLGFTVKSIILDSDITIVFYTSEIRSRAPSMVTE